MKSPILRAVLTASLFLPSGMAQASDYSGTAGYSFLNIPVGARATAMGQAFTAVTNDVQGLAYNPASLASLLASQFSFQHLTYVESITQDSVQYGNAGRDQAISWGTSVNYLRVGGIPRTTATGSETGDGFTEHGDFSTYDLALGGTVAGRLREDLLVGGTLKFIREDLGDAAANAAATDVGLLWRSNESRSWSFGMSLLNVGMSSKFSEAAVPLPTTFRAGFAGRPFAQWLLSADYAKRRDTRGEFDVGAEIAPKSPMVLRFGYRYALQRPDLGTLSDFSAGFGFRQPRWSVDYAFVPLGDLGLTHRVSLNFRLKSRVD